MFALSSALGVVGGITMSFQSGTNWPSALFSVWPSKNLRRRYRHYPRNVLFTFILYLSVYVGWFDIKGGVAFDFKDKVEQVNKHRWNQIFKLGSYIAAASLGYMLGRFVMGSEESFMAYAFAILSA